MKRKKNPITRSSILQKLYEEELKKTDAIISAVRTSMDLDMAAARLLGIYQSKKNGKFAIEMLSVVGILRSDWFYNRVSLIVGRTSYHYIASCFMGKTQRFEEKKVKEYMKALKIEDILNGTMRIDVEAGLVSCISIVPNKTEIE